MHDHLSLQAASHLSDLLSVIVILLYLMCRVEAHPIPEHPRPRRCKGRIALVGDAAGYVTKCSGEGIYFAAKSGRMCAEAIVEASEGGKKMCGEGAIRVYLDK
jgi:geranylgeranyl reductase